MERMLNLAREVQKHFRYFYLAGGTAIMFRYNHRKSDDLDFLTSRVFSVNRLIDRVRKFFTVESYEVPGDNVDFVIDGIKVSFVFFPFKNLRTVKKFRGIRIPDDYDLFLNKIYVAGRRVDWKDPFDAAYLLRLHQWKYPDVKKDFETKFPSQSFEIYFGAILSFDEYPSLPDWVKDVLTKFARQI